MSTEVIISLIPHLRETLALLVPVLPPPRAEDLSEALSHDTIRYSLLLSLSRWTRQPDAQQLLKSSELDPSAYAMIPLLAGTKTNPDRRFPPHRPVSDTQTTNVARQTTKQVTALLNALLSIIGAGVASWFIAKSAGWKNEWRVLLGLGVSIVVALSEAGLYAIYASRQEKKSKSKRLRLTKPKDKKDELKELIEEPPTVISDNPSTDGLRRRTHT